MKRLLSIPEYQGDLQRVVALPLPWNKLRGKTILITGGTGLIGSFLIDVLATAELGCNVLMLGRSEEKAKARFEEYWDRKWLKFAKWDASEPRITQIELKGTDGVAYIDYVLHLASNTHPVAYANDPVSTIVMNVSAAKELLDLAVAKRTTRFVYASSVEIYGQNRGDVEKFSEDYCGYIDCNTLRAGYPESKRCGEALCQAYKEQKGLDVVVARLTRSFGPTLLPTDTKALSQFLRNGLNHEDIVLKSAGNQHYSYTYTADAVTGLLTVLTLGENGEAYNISDQTCDVRLKELAAIIAKIAGTQVIFDLPSETEKQGFSKATKARLDGSKLHALGWSASFSIEEGLHRTLSCLK